MTTARRYLPHPLLSVVLLVAWLWLNNTIHPGHIVLGSLLAVAIPYFTRHFWPEPIVVDRPLKVIQYVVIVCYDIVLANLELAVLILGPHGAVAPRIRARTAGAPHGFCNHAACLDGDAHPRYGLGRRRGKCS
jgi:multicomponent K+:H+ antiporter subunit E